MFLRCQTQWNTSFGGVAYGEADGVTMLEIPYTLVPSSANDELSIVFT